MQKPRKRLSKKQLKEDKLVTYTFLVRDFIEENWKKITIGIIAVLIVIALVFIYINSKKKATQDASYQLSIAERKYLNGDYENAIKELSLVANNFSGTSSAGVAVFYLANSYFFIEDYKNAEENYRKYINDYGGDKDLLCSAYSGLGAVYEEKKEYQKAAEYYMQAAEKFPKNFQAPECMLDAARCYKYAGNYQKAEKILDKLAEKYSDSPVIREANILIASLK